MELTQVGRVTAGSRLSRAYIWKLHEGMGVGDYLHAYEKRRQDCGKRAFPRTRSSGASGEVREVLFKRWRESPAAARHCCGAYCVSGSAHSTEDMYLFVRRGAPHLGPTSGGRDEGLICCEYKKQSRLLRAYSLLSHDPGRAYVGGASVVQAILGDGFGRLRW